MEDVVRVYIKGAAEFILPKCVRTFGVDGNKQPMADDQLDYILTNIISKEFTTKGYRVLAFAYKDMSLEDF
jgi:magnesium-transporting ATPase (P-type)